MQPHLRIALRQGLGDFVIALDAVDDALEVGNLVVPDPLQVAETDVADIVRQELERLLPTLMLGQGL